MPANIITLLEMLESQMKGFDLNLIIIRPTQSEKMAKTDVQILQIYGDYKPKCNSSVVIHLSLSYLSNKELPE